MWTSQMRNYRWVEKKRWINLDVSHWKYRVDYSLFASSRNREWSRKINWNFLAHKKKNKVENVENDVCFFIIFFVELLGGRLKNQNVYWERMRIFHNIRLGNLTWNKLVLKFVTYWRRALIHVERALDNKSVIMWKVMQKAFYLDTLLYVCVCVCRFGPKSFVIVLIATE